MDQATKTTRTPHPYWSCKRKRRYTSQVSAEKEIRRIRKTGKVVDNAHVYPCSFCHGWHLAHKNDLIEYVSEMPCREDCEEQRLFDTDIQPVDRIALRVVMPGIHYDIPEGTIPDHHMHSSTPLPVRRIINQIKMSRGFCDLTGRRQGRLTVMGLSSNVNGKWVVRCQCGAYEVRSAKALMNPKNDSDRCWVCRHEVTRRRKDEWVKTGGNAQSYMEMMRESK